jgi:hypothetical protein
MSISTGVTFPVTGGYRPGGGGGIPAVFSTARVYMDFTAGFYIGRAPADFTGTPSISAAGLLVTGAGNTVSMASTAFSGWFNAVAGTFFVEFVQIAAGGGGLGRVFEVNDGTTTETINIFYNTTYNMNVTDGGVLQASPTVTAPAFGSVVRVAMRYAANDFHFCVNGTLGAADTSGTLPTVTQIHFGNRADTTRELNGYIRRFAYLPAISTNAVLQSMTA